MGPGVLRSMKYFNTVFGKRILFTLDRSMASVSKSLCCCVAVTVLLELCVLDARLSKRVAISLLTELSSF